jgi:hypothetical protein
LLAASIIRALLSSPEIFRVSKSSRMRWMGHAVRMGKINTYTNLIGKFERKRPCERPECRWKRNNIKIFKNRV